ncbi:MAG: PhnD/SsuA/transferrin family substrate-binding protein [Proteobacteria bacterium]|nr:PhnD/SsuA/transferrin family substrate-binding protein [Pseudomonadota bacterium]
MLILVRCLVFLFCTLISFQSLHGTEQMVEIGVLAKRGAERVYQQWQPTADYLTDALPGYRFKVIPLGFNEIDAAVQKSRVHFVLANSAFYVELEKRYGVSRIATLINQHMTGKQTTIFGGVIFSRADRNDIQTLSDFKRKSFMAVDAMSFGGWIMAWREFDRNGIDPFTFFSRLQYGETHDAVVFGVRDGLADGGTVRTDTLERMAGEGKIDLADFKILNQKQEGDFPFLHSTALYPEWPMAAVQTTPKQLSRLVASALMAMDEKNSAAIAGKIAGWTIPLNYQSVHDCLLALRISPYESYGKFTLMDVVKKYLLQFVLLLLVIVFIFSVSFYIFRLNRDLSNKKAEVDLLNQNLEVKVEDRTKEIENLLEREIYLREILQTVADVNELLVTSANLEKLLGNSCSRFVRHSYYDFAWVGLLEEKKITQIFSSDAEHLQEIPPFDPEDSGSPFSRSATAQCLLQNTTVVQLYNPDGPGITPLHKGKLISGLQWVVALPLRADRFSQPIGALSVYTWRKQGFEGEEISMLEELAGDLGFAITAYGHRQAVAYLETERTENYEDTILSFVNMIDHRDTYTAGHTLRVAHYCQLIALEMGYDEEEIEVLKKAAILHDIGKIATPDSVLLKPGKLTESDYDLIKLHATAGFEMLSRIKMYHELAEIIHQHHERHDGQGYPMGLKGDEIHPFSRIMSLADAFDAMTTNRIYKPRKKLDEVLTELATLKGIQFHPAVVDAAIKVLHDISIITSINQLPVTELERKRFSYFFNDKLTGLYNENYMQIILQNNLECFEYTCINTFHPKMLQEYNKKAGWEQGNWFLQEFAEELRKTYPDSLVFRAFGNDFIVLAKKHNEISRESIALFNSIRKSGIDIEVHHIDLLQDRAYTMKTLEQMGMMAGWGQQRAG